MLKSQALRALAIAGACICLPTPSSAQDANVDLCAAVEGLCAAAHFNSRAEFDSSLLAEIAALATASENVFANNPGFREPDPLLTQAAASTLRNAQIVATPGLSVPGANERERARTSTVDTTRFGPGRGAQNEPGLAGLSGLTGPTNTLRGAAGRARAALIASGTPNRGSTTRMGGTQPGSPDLIAVPQMDVSYKNEHGGVTRMSYGEDGTYKVVETRSYKDGHSETGILLERGGRITNIETTFGRDGVYQFQMRMTQESPTAPYVHEYAESLNWGLNWSSLRRFEGNNQVPNNPPRPRDRNVDPDAVGGRSSQPPACAFANPECDMPLMIRFFENRPDRRSRPDDTAQATPRLRPATCTATWSTPAWKPRQLRAQPLSRNLHGPTMAVR